MEPPSSPTSIFVVRIILCLDIILHRRNWMYVCRYRGGQVRLDGARVTRMYVKFRPGIMLLS
jgi:hypothetical protein